MKKTLGYEKSCLVQKGFDLAAAALEKKKKKGRSFI
jgi:hypothetical protein